MKLNEKNEIAPGLRGDRKMEDLLAHRPGQGAKGTRTIEKRERNLFKKLMNYRVSRMLKVLKYTPSQSDERKFTYSNYRNQVKPAAPNEFELTQRSGDSSMLGSPQPVDLNFKKRNLSTVAYAY